MTVIGSSMADRFRQFLIFAFLSGLGWICDFTVFILLVRLLNVPAFLANFFSSYVGVTFVWFASLQNLFGRAGSFRGRFLFVYWSFQFISILFYSGLLDLSVLMFQTSKISASLTGYLEIITKIIVTPFNLVTNFLFMKFLTRFMPRIKIV